MGAAWEIGETAHARRCNTVETIGFHNPASSGAATHRAGPCKTRIIQEPEIPMTLLLNLAGMALVLLAGLAIAAAASYPR